MINARAIQFRGRGGLEVIALGQTPVRSPGPGELLVEVAAAGLNRADILQRQGFYAAPPGTIGDVPGLEYSGTVAAVGCGVRAFGIGDKVMGIVAGGGMASHIVVHERETIAVPGKVSLIEAAAIPEAFLTVYDALFMQAALTMGQRLLVHAVGSGIGTAALQLAQVAGAHVIGTSRSQAKLDACKRFGLVDGIVVKNARFAEAVCELTRGQLVDVILDSVGAAYLSENVAAIASRGKIVILGLLGGATGNLPLATLLSKRAHVIGTVLRNRPLEERAVLAKSFAHHVLPLFERGVLRPVIDAVLQMDQIADAHQRMEANDNIGKIVLHWA
ncbi:MAG TPA: NAD(P)H-quinone oxidoreductase [Vicinamibacterales bacterium]|nr:NAD(P)H-quinone oxidoreductase [Vicinamibacterales bacterium]